MPKEFIVLIMKRFLLLLLPVFWTAYTSAQTLRIDSTRYLCSPGAAPTLGRLTCVIQTRDGGFFFTGKTGGPGGGPIPACPTKPSGNAIMGKLDATGAVQWIKNMCDTVIWSNTALQTPDGGYLINGGTYPWNSMSLFRYDSLGNYLWRQDYGKDAGCGSHQFINTPDGGFLMYGACRGIDTDVVVNYAWPPSTFQPQDWVLTKMDSLGRKQWIRTVGTSGQEGAGRIVCDGTYYYLIGSTTSKDYDCADTANHPLIAIYIIKFDSAGNKIWSRARGGGSIVQVAYDVRDNSLVVAGHGDGGHEIGRSGFQGGATDFFMMKLDTAANFKWGKLYGTPYSEYNPAFCEGPNGGYFVCGRNDSPPNPSGKGVLISIDSSGRQLEFRLISSTTGYTSFNQIFPLQQGGYRVFGLTNGLNLNEGTGQSCAATGGNGAGALLMSFARVVPLAMVEKESVRQIFTLAPNPASGRVEVRLGKEGRGGGWIVCTDAGGREAVRLRVGAGERVITLKTVGWASGAYTVCWLPESGARQCQNLIVR